MLLFGKTVWLQEADPFTRLYHYLAKFAPLARENGGELRMNGVGLVPDEESHYRPCALLLLTVSFVWQSQVAMIVLGHIVAVWVAHQIALDVFADRRQAIKNQIPMMGLMVIYTMLSLWILTRPSVTPPLP